MFSTTKTKEKQKSRELAQSASAKQQKNHQSLHMETGLYMLVLQPGANWILSVTEEGEL